MEKAAVRFKRMGIITVAAVYFLILVGGIVRSTGAGMGCPDWPKCFGMWIPPMDVSQLPANFQEVYQNLGYVHAAFNPIKTWTEYINRLIGVMIGICIFLTFLFSLAYLKRDRMVPFLALMCFLLVGFEGWLGRLVVESNLRPWLITAHMLGALLLVLLLIYTVARSQCGVLGFGEARKGRVLPWLIGLCLALSIIQVILGVQVREVIDEVSLELEWQKRETWILGVGAPFYIHRSFSLVVLAVNVGLVAALAKAAPGLTAARRAGRALIAIILLAIATGAGLYYLHFPPALQPLHLLLSTLMFGAQTVILIFYLYARDSRAPGAGSGSPVSPPEAE